MKAGRPKNISSPEEMWQLYQDYKVFAKSNPFKVQDYVGKDGVMVYREKERCLSKEGFSTYLNDIGVIHDPYDYFFNTGGRYEEFKGVCSRIMRDIRREQIEGGMAGIYSQSITQRLNGLTEKTETQSNNLNTNKIIIEEVKRTSLPEGSGGNTEQS